MQPRRLKDLLLMFHHGSVKRLRTDNGGEFISEEFRKLITSNKIKHEFSAPNSAHQNGTAERSWRTLFEMARCMQLESGLPKNLWTYAVKAASYTRNRCYSRRTKKTPYEMLNSRKPDIRNMHSFGSK